MLNVSDGSKADLAKRDPEPLLCPILFIGNPGLTLGLHEASALACDAELTEAQRVATHTNIAGQDTVQSGGEGRRRGRCTGVRRRLGQSGRRPGLWRIA